MTDTAAPEAEVEIPLEAAAAASVALARLPDPGAIANVFGLPEGSVEINGLRLTNPDTTFDDWQSYGHVVGAFGRWHRFALGDWLLFGEAIFGEDSAQAVESTAAERYDVAARITGLRVPTLQNYASLCGRVPLPIRRAELGFGVHEPVAALERDDQIRWLAAAVENGWDRDDLRQAIKDEKNPPSQEEPEVVDPDYVSAGERAVQVLRLVYQQGQPADDGGVYIPPETWAQVAAVLGEE